MAFSVSAGLTRCAVSQAKELAGVAFSVPDLSSRSWVGKNGPHAQAVAAAATMKAPAIATRRSIRMQNHPLADNILDSFSFRLKRIRSF